MTVTPILAGSVDVDFNMFVLVAGVFLFVGLLLACYLACRQLSRGQWLIVSCVYISIMLFWLWLSPIPVPYLNSTFRRLQPYLSIVLIVIALASAMKSYRRPRLQTNSEDRSKLN